MKFCTSTWCLGVFLGRFFCMVFFHNCVEVAELKEDTAVLGFFPSHLVG